MSEAESGLVFEVGDADFHTQVIERSKERPVIVDFWAPWCGPCRMLAPALERLVAERGGQVLLAKVNVDEAPESALAYQIEVLPTVKAFRDGRPVLEFVGLPPEPQIHEFLDRLIPTPADRLAAEARSLEGSDMAGAEALYRQALEGNPAHEASIVGLARLLIERDMPEEASQLLDRAGPGGEWREEVQRLQAILFLHHAARELGDEAAARRRLEAEPDNARRHYELALVLAAEGHYPEALQALLSAAERDRDFGRGPVREAMLKVFQVIGVRSELADEYRDKLSRLLY